MTPALKTQWTTALRSGAYRQGTGSLCTDTGTGPRFCCLGVLADVLHVPYRVQGRVRRYHFVRDKIHSAALVPTDFQGLTVDTILTLSHLNDKGTPFAEIADWIDTNL